MLHFMWMMITGSLLTYRGALFPALQAIGLEAAAVRRAWRAFRHGVWQIRGLLAVWRAHVQTWPEWEVQEYEGYRAVPVDIAPFWRPKLHGCPSKHYHPQAGRALPAVIMGLIGEVGRIGGQRLALLRYILRARPADPAESTLITDLLKHVSQTLGPREVSVFDAGFPLRQVQAADLDRYIVRLPRNCTARRNTPAPYSGRGRPPEYGEKIRPLPRTYAGREIAGSEPDETRTWQAGGQTLRAHIWRDLVRSDVRPNPDAQTFDIYVLYDSRYADPWVLAVSIPLHAASVYAMYKDRWPIEQLPLSAKQMLGAHRQFVFAPESVQRLPELALLMGSVLSFLAATTPPTPTGFWDREPRRTPGRFRRTLQGQPFPHDFPLPRRIRKKDSATAHLPKGIQAHRRRPQPEKPVASG